mgnify:CR=1 FL=1
MPDTFICGCTLAFADEWGAEAITETERGQLAVLAAVYDAPRVDLALHLAAPNEGAPD